MSDYTPTAEVIRHALAFPRERLGEPRPVKREEFARWHAEEIRKAKARGAPVPRCPGAPLVHREEAARLGSAPGP